MHTAPDSTGDQGAGSRPQPFAARLSQTAQHRRECPHPACRPFPVPAPLTTCPSHSRSLDWVILLSPWSPPLHLPFPVPKRRQLRHQLVTPCDFFPRVFFGILHPQDPSSSPVALKKFYGWPLRARGRPLQTRSPAEERRPARGASSRLTADAHSFSARSSRVTRRRLGPAGKACP